VKATAIDPKTKAVIEHEASNATSKDTGLAPQKLIITGISAKDGSATGDFVQDTGSSATIRSTEKTAKGVERQAQGMYAKNQMAAAQLTINCKGDPVLVGKSVITVEGIGNTISGNYYVSNVAHKVDKSFTMTIKCKRDGRSASSNNAAQGAAAGTGTGAGEGVGAGGPTNTETPPDGAGGGSKEGGGELRSVLDPRTGELKYTDTGGRSQASAPKGPT
jgi:hypothetical protein